MSWFRLDDKSHSHAKVIAAGNAAWGLFCRLGAWSSDQLTDGFIPDQVAKSMGTARELKALTESPIPGVGALMERVDGGYRMPDFLDFNRSRIDVEAERESARERMRKRRRSSSDVRANNGGSSDSVQEPRPVPSPSTTGSTQSRRLTGEHDDDESVDNYRDQSVDSYRVAADHLAALKTERANPESPKVYHRTVRTNIDAEDGDEIRRLLDTFPGAPATSIAAAVLTGDTRTLAGYRKDTA